MHLEVLLVIYQHHQRFVQLNLHDLLIQQQYLLEQQYSILLRLILVLYLLFGLLIEHKNLNYILLHLQYCKLQLRCSYLAI